MISCLMITTNKPSRLKLLQQAVQYIDNLPIKFEKKILE